VIVVADLGATYLRVALATGGELGAVTRCRTSDLDIDAALGVTSGIVGAMRKVLLDATGATAAAGVPTEPRAIGLGVPAAVDERGAVYRSLDFGVPAGTVMRDAIGAAFGVPVAVDNDANLAVLGEYYRGAGRSTRDFILLTLGTNIGMGAVFDGQIFRGATGGAGEAGMLLVPVDTIGLPIEPDGRRLVDSGRFGTGLSRAPAGYAWIEELVGGGALARAAEGRRGRRAGPARASLGDGRRQSARVFRQAAAGNEHAGELVERAIEGWAFTIANLVAVLDPDTIALSGGLVGDIAPFLDRLRRRATELSRVAPRIMVAELGARAGLVGADIAARRVAGEMRVHAGAP
jgi:glucokinase